jgi:hypothetical protein
MLNEVYHAEKEMERFSSGAGGEAAQRRMRKPLRETRAGEKPVGWLAAHVTRLLNAIRAAFAQALRPSWHRSLE